MIYRQGQRTMFLLDYAGQRFLVNPMFQKSERESEVPFKELLDVDAVIAMHLSESSFDQEARRLIPRGMKIFVRNETDAKSLEGDGFFNLEILTERTEFQHVGIRKVPVYKKTEGRIREDEESCGIMIHHPVLNSVYLAGRGTWYDGMRKMLKRWKPRVIVVSPEFAGKKGSRFGMSREDTAAVHLSYPRARIIVNRCPEVIEDNPAAELLPREELRSYMQAQRMEAAFLFPESGEEYRM